MDCTKCTRSAPAIRAIGMERARINKAVATFDVTKYSGATERLALCEEHRRAMVSAGMKVAAI